MDFESPDVEKDFPGLYASDPLRQSQERESDYSDDSHEKPSKKDLLIGKRKERKESKKDKGYVAFEEESSGEELDSEQKSPTKSRKSKSTFKFSKRDKSKEKTKEKKEDKKEEKEKEKKKEKKVKLKLKDLKKSKHAEDDNDKDRIIFGMPLRVGVERSKCHDGIELPIIVRECIDYIEEHGLSCEGIYRLSGVKSKVQKLKNQYNRGEQVCLYEHEPHIVASLLKLYLRELPDPVLTNELMPKFEEACALKDPNKRIELLKKLIDDLPICNCLLLSWIFVHMGHIIQRENVNKMSVQNVSIVLSPTMQISHRVLNVLFMHGSILFKDVILKKYIPPLKPEMSRSSLELPDSPSAIQDEILKQESLLSQLHADMFSGVADQEKEEQLWEVQRIVTQLKRKLRFAKRAQGIKKDDERAAAPSAPEDSEIDTRLQSISQEKTQPLKVSTDHKCTVYVPWQSNRVEADKKSTVSQEQESQSVKNEVVVVSEPSDVSIKQHSETEGADEDVGDGLKTNIIPLNVNEGDDKQENKDIQQENLDDFSNGDDVCTHDLDNAEENFAIQRLITEERVLRVQQEELGQLSSELRRKIETERHEVERLKNKIQELRVLYRYRSLSCDSAENSSDDDCSDSEDDVGEDEEEEDSDETLLQNVNDLQEENRNLERQNEDLIERIQLEREACLEAKVQIRLLQQKQEEVSNRQHGKTTERAIY